MATTPATGFDRNGDKAGSEFRASNTVVIRGQAAEVLLTEPNFLSQKVEIVGMAATLLIFRPLFWSR